MNKQLSPLIIGADSLIGSSLMNNFELSGINVQGTTRRSYSSSNNLIFFDLTSDISRLELPLFFNSAVICAGIASLEECRQHPNKTYCINVKAISSLVDKLVGNGIFVVYISTNKVFDGSKSYQSADDPLSPITEYGKQKAEVENNISKHGNMVSILRLSKVLVPNNSLFSEWKKALLSNQAIHPFSDMYMSPIPVSLVVKVVLSIIDIRLSGILQVSGNKDISYADAGKIGCRVLGANNQLIKPAKATNIKPDIECIAANTTLNTDRLRSELKLESPDVKQTIKSAFVIKESAAEEYPAHIGLR